MSFGTVSNNQRLADTVFKSERWIQYPGNNRSDFADRCICFDDLNVEKLIIFDVVPDNAVSGHNQHGQAVLNDFQ